MTEQEMQKVVREELHRIAPDVDSAGLDAAADLREAADIDSVDFLNLLIAVGKRTGVEIPDRDAGALTSVGALAAYVAAHGGGAR
jgi:acyl carrier protein